MPVAGQNDRQSVVTVCLRFDIIELTAFTYLGRSLLKSRGYQSALALSYPPLERYHDDVGSLRLFGLPSRGNKFQNSIAACCAAA